MAGSSWTPPARAGRPWPPRTALDCAPGCRSPSRVDWADLTEVTPADFTIRTAPALLADGDPWAALMPAPQPLPADLVAEGRTIPVARVQAMHEGKRRARARREAG